MQNKLTNRNQSFSGRLSLVKNACLLLLLSFMACFLLFQLKPSQNDNIGSRDLAPKQSQANSSIQVNSYGTKSEVSAQLVGTNDNLLPLKTAQDELIEASPETYVSEDTKVTGKIKLSPQQYDQLKGVSPWGGPNLQAKAVIDSIPAEAFANDW